MSPEKSYALMDAIIAQLGADDDRSPVELAADILQVVDRFFPDRLERLSGEREGWRLIESAPRDGTKLLMFGTLHEIGWNEGETPPP